MHCPKNLDRQGSRLLKVADFLELALRTERQSRRIYHKISIYYLCLHFKKKQKSMFRNIKPIRYANFLGFFLILTLLFACRQNAKPAWGKDAQAEIGTAISDSQTRTNAASSTQRKAPDYVYDVWEYVVQNGRAKRGYVGGRTFQNREKRLPLHVKYREWDVHKKVKGKNRGAERLVTGSDKSAYYTKDHYRTFTRLDQ